MNDISANKIVTISTIKIIVFICLVFGSFFYSGFVTESFGQKKKSSSKKYSSFPHSKHRQTCNSCHKFPSANWKSVRKDPFPDITDYPKHDSCLKCHRQQFFGSPKPNICSICHTNPSPRNSSRHPFPNPREVFDKSAKGRNAVSDFSISFPHDTHTDIISENIPTLRIKRKPESLFVKASLKRISEESCSVCHQTYKPQGDSDDEYFTKPPKDLGDEFWLKKGTFKTVPISHTNCFTCHSIDTGMSPSPDNCAACHKLKQKVPKPDFDSKVAAPMKISDKIMLTAWRNRDSSATFRHEFSSHADLECATCHNVSTMNTLNAVTKKVNVISCAVCHITETSDDGGILNYEVDSRKTNPKFQCVKCHIAFGKLAIPESHIKAIEAQK